MRSFFLPGSPYCGYCQHPELLTQEVDNSIIWSLGENMVTLPKENIWTSFDPKRQANWQSLSIQDQVQLHSLLRAGFIQSTFNLGGEIIARRELCSTSLHQAKRPPRPWVLSRFALIRRQEDNFLVESPCAYSRVIFQKPEIAQLLCSAQRPDKEVSQHDLHLLEFFCDSGLLVSSQEKEPQEWTHHELLFHSRSRSGRSHPRRRPYSSDLPPLVRPPISDDITELPCKAPSDSKPLSQLLQVRRSKRDSGEESLTIDSLSEFLSRSLEVLSSSDDVSRRPTPSAGALHELEVYLGVNNCPGLEKGLYRYNPFEHHLEKAASECGKLLSNAASGQGTETLPGVLVIIAARFARSSWKYGGYSYSLTLKNAGALMQTMSLVATDLGLGSCCSGRGDSDEFARLTGLKYEIEGSVAEFTLR